MQWITSGLVSVSTLLLCAVVLFGDCALAGTVSVKQTQCGAEITLVANDAKLSEVFKELATELGFALRFDRDSDRTVSIESTRKPEKLIESLTRDDNIMITTQDDPNCAGRNRITEVRFLAAGDAIVLPAHVPTDAPPMPASPIPISRPKTLRIKKDESRKRRRYMTPEERAQDHERRQREQKR